MPSVPSTVPLPPENSPAPDSLRSLAKDAAHARQPPWAALSSPNRQPVRFQPHVSFPLAASSRLDEPQPPQANSSCQDRVSLLAVQKRVETPRPSPEPVLERSALAGLLSRSSPEPSDAPESSPPHRAPRRG